MKHSELITGLRARLFPRGAHDIAPVRPQADDYDLLLAVAQICTRLESGADFSIANVVSHRDGQGKLDVTWLGMMTQIEPVKAREIAWLLLEGAAIAESESSLIRFLQDRIGLKPEGAAQILQDFRRHREHDPTGLIGAEETH